MRCALQALVAVLPPWIRTEVRQYEAENLQEIRLRYGQTPELCCAKQTIYMDRVINKEDLSYVVNAASQYSPWNATSISQGYLTAPGGHRIGLCGHGVIRDGKLAGIREVTSLCIRVARDFPGIAEGIPSTGSVLIIGRPGAGKTTLLRDLIRQRSGKETVAVVDERGELFPPEFAIASRADVLTGCGKPEGIDAVLRSMSPSCIAVDEITAEGDCEALLRAGWCGVNLLATAHAASFYDLAHRPIYKTILDKKLFDTLVILQRDKSWQKERIDI